MNKPRVASGPAELVAIANAAHMAGDRDLKRVAVRSLREQFGIVIAFKKLGTKSREVSHAS